MKILKFDVIKYVEERNL